jgi:hypothetical protein
MDDSEKIANLVEDYEEAQRVIDNLNGQYNSADYRLGRMIYASRWMPFMRFAYNLYRSTKSKFLNLTWPQKGSIPEINLKYMDTLALYDYKIAVYSCITGAYDRVIEPHFKPSNVDFLLVTDDQLPATSAWRGIDISTIKGLPALDNSYMNRYVKLHPHLFLDDYDYSIYIDGNIRIVGDIRYLIHLLNQYGLVSTLHRSRDCIYQELEACILQNKDNHRTMEKQISLYKRRGMSKHQGLIEASLLVMDHHNPICIEIMERWWQEIAKYSTRDQLSLPFVLWEMGIPISEIGKIGNNVYKIPMIQIEPHSKSKHF